jgi:pilus assembly protein CpaE
VYSPKGGVGTTTLAVNLACALRTLGRRVAIVDGNVSFGNVGILLNLRPSRGMLDLAAGTGPIADSSVDDALIPHESGIRAMLAPPTPEDGDHITREHLCTIVNALRTSHDYVVVDTWSSYDERALAILEVSDQILVPTAPELQSIHNLIAFLRVARLLEYPEQKLVPVLMRADSVEPGYLKELEQLLERPFTWRVVSDGRRVTQSVIEGKPFVLSDPAALVSQNIYALAGMIDGTGQADAAAKSGRRSWKQSLFGRAKAS